jgi:hypothetical protein
MDPDDGAPGKRSPAPSEPRQTVTLLLRKTRDQARIEGLDPDIWAEDDYAIVDPDTNRRVGRIYPERSRASRSGCGSCRPIPRH